MQYRQGDVYVIRQEQPQSVGAPIPRIDGRIVLAYGEATGHHHSIYDKAATLYEIPDMNDRFLKIMSTVTLTHQEHASITLPPGEYIVRVQREYVAPEITRNVAD